MRKYLDTREASGELLRLVIPRMAQHPGGCHPASYALWYEYLSGCNPALKEAVDGELQENKPLDNEAVNALCARFVAGPDVVTGRQHADLQRLMGELSQHAAAAGMRAGEYHHLLGQHGEQLSNGSGAAELGDKVIRSVAQTMAAHVKGQDTAARIGGEAFAILLPDTPLQGARRLRKGESGAATRAQRRATSRFHSVWPLIAREKRSTHSCAARTRRSTNQSATGAIASRSPSRRPSSPSAARRKAPTPGHHLARRQEQALTFPIPGRALPKPLYLTSQLQAGPSYC